MQKLLRIHICRCVIVLLYFVCFALFCFVQAERFGALTAKCRQLSTNLGIGIGVFAGLTNMFTNAIVLSVVYFGGRLIEQNVQWGHIDCLCSVLHLCGLCL